jgi:hypothetical protein
MKRLLGLLFLVAAAAVAGSVSRSADTPGLAALKFLEGKWVGEGSSEAGPGGGYATFEEDLQGKVIVRRNHAEYPASHDRAAYQHDDLMVIYVDPSAKGTRAFYTDNEGHVIHYTVSVSADGNTVTFLADREPGAAQYRLTYVRRDQNRMTILLEGRGASQDAQFQKIVEGKMVKTTAM